MGEAERNIERVVRENADSHWASMYAQAVTRYGRAESALREIASYNPEELESWDESNAADMCRIARAALAEGSNDG